MGNETGKEMQRENVKENKKNQKLWDNSKMKLKNWYESNAMKNERKLSRKW